VRNLLLVDTWSASKSPGTKPEVLTDEVEHSMYDIVTPAKQASCIQNAVGDRPQSRRQVALSLRAIQWTPDALGLDAPAERFSKARALRITRRLTDEVGLRRVRAGAGARPRFASLARRGRPAGLGGAPAWAPSSLSL